MSPAVGGFFCLKRIRICNTPGREVMNLNLALNAQSEPAKASGRRLMLLAPANAVVPSDFCEARSDRGAYETLLSDMQRFRGLTYLNDGAITASELDESGRHRLDVDVRSWHIVTLDAQDAVCGCARYTEYPTQVEFSELRLSNAAIATCETWGGKFRAAIEREKRLARREHARFVEVGGWAIAETLRKTTEALRIALATYALAQTLGPAIVLTTATVRHHSAAVLRKIGGRSLFVGSNELPRYFDKQYDCEMELLRFESSSPNPKFEPWIEQIRSEMSSVDVVCPRLQLRPAGFSPRRAAAETVESIRLPLAWQFR